MFCNWLAEILLMENTWREKFCVSSTRKHTFHPSKSKRILRKRKCLSCMHNVFLILTFMSCVRPLNILSSVSCLLLSSVSHFSQVRQLLVIIFCNPPSPHNSIPLLTAYFCQRLHPGLDGTTEQDRGEPNTVSRHSKDGLSGISLSMISS